MKKLDIPLDYRDTTWIENVVVGAENNYRKISNYKEISKCEHVVKHVTAENYKFTLMAVIENRIRPDQIKPYIIDSRNALYSFLAKRYANINISNIPNLKFKYIGPKRIEDLTPGNIYTAIEFSNWFHNPDEIGFYMRTDDYQGNDADYGHFFSLSNFHKYFKEVK